MTLQSAPKPTVAPNPGTTVPRIGSHIPALDGLRGIAILLVMLYHFAWAAPPVGVLSKVWVFGTTFGWTGVDLFFVLSGFLITGILLESKDGPGYFRNFYARRVLRIFPLYYGILAITLVVLPRFVSYDDPDMRLLLKEQGWLWGYSANVSVAVRHGEVIWDAAWLRLAGLWSLAVEEHFYLVWPLLVWLLSRRSLVRLTTAILVLTPAIRLGARLAGVHHETIYMLTIFRADALAMGALLALVVRDPDLHRKVRAAAPWAAIASGLVVAAPVLRRRLVDNKDFTLQTLGYTALAVLYGLLVLAAVSGPATSRLTRALSNRWLMFLGKYSYGAYMLHDLMRPVYLRLFPVAGIQHYLRLQVLGYLVHTALGIATTYGLALLSFHLFEMRFLEMKRFFEYRRAPAHAGIPSEAPPRPDMG
jgi:peptidoglycan/LPS O-acetylase OafA/YrhL